MSLTFTILGCGSSMGVPRVALGWGSCDPNNPKNRRRRCALLVERVNAQGRRTRVLVDCTPDLREQLLEAQIVDAMGVVGMLMGDQHAVEPIDLRLEQLLAQIRRAVDQNAGAAALNIAALHQ